MQIDGINHSDRSSLPQAHSPNRENAAAAQPDRQDYPKVRLKFRDRTAPRNRPATGPQGRPYITIPIHENCGIFGCSKPNNHTGELYTEFLFLDSYCSSTHCVLPSRSLRHVRHHCEATPAANSVVSPTRPKHVTIVDNVPRNIARPRRSATAIKKQKAMC